MERKDVEELIYGKPDRQRRFTQDFPILPDVWIAYAELPEDREKALAGNAHPPSERIELLLTPHTRSDAATLARALRERMKQELPAIINYRLTHPGVPAPVVETPRILFNEAVIFADFTFEELLRVAMPLTDWWKTSGRGSPSLLAVACPEHAQRKAGSCDSRRVARLRTPPSRIS